ncbi:MAG: SMC-Scp complex subunit ScpB [Spirochaetales bacterium]|nr:SMC-Scp complex subunit ScpB [Spirochaetales bacterium]
MPNSLSSETRYIESILYLENEPIDLAAICRISSFQKDIVVQALAELKIHYSEGNHGIEISEFAGGFHFMPKEDLWPELKNHYGRKIDRRLSKSALETISIIAYSQPITRREVENIRGVSSDNVLRLLLEREYVHVIGRKDVLGRPFLYGTTKKFLQDFNLKSISSLPKLGDLDKERFNEQE